jgi:hypothetical protein
LQLHSFDYGKADLFERTQRPEIVLLWIGKHCSNGWIGKDDLVNKVANYVGSESNPDHLRFTDSQVDTGGVRSRANLERVFCVVRPSVPLNPSDGSIVMLNYENVRWLFSIDSLAVLSLNTG